MAGPKRTARRYLDPGMSANCRAQHAMPHRPHEARCTGCTCACHAVRPPSRFREIADQARAAARARRETSGPGERGEAPPGPGTGGAA